MGFWAHTAWIKQEEAAHRAKPVCFIIVIVWVLFFMVFSPHVGWATIVLTSSTKHCELVQDFFFFNHFLIDVCKSTDRWSASYLPPSWSASYLPPSWYKDQANSSESKKLMTWSNATYIRSAQLSIGDGLRPTSMWKLRSAGHLVFPSLSPLWEFQRLQVGT